MRSPASLFPHLYVGKYVHFVPENNKIGYDACTCTYTCTCIWTAYNVSCDSTHMQVFYLFIYLVIIVAFYAYTCTLYVAL